MKRFNPEKELKKIQKSNKNKIIIGVITLLIIIAIGSSYALYQVRYSKRIIYTKVADFSKDLNLAVYVNGEKQSKMPSKDSGYKYAGIECEDGVPYTEWDEEKWNFKQISDINVPNKCNVYFSDTVQEYSLTNSIETYTVPKTGTYKLEVWGAEGGSTWAKGGLGGYSVGNIYLSKDDILYIVVGGAGIGGEEHISREGGYNGGGTPTPDSDSNVYIASGGGATHIATKTGLLKDLEKSRDSILIVAGGGGGAATNRTDQEYKNVPFGGPGGGLQTSIIGYCLGATQSEGGVCTDSTQTEGRTEGRGSFGLGGSSAGVGGGGGYYGGGSCYYYSTGGSGYLNSNKLIANTTNSISGINSGDGKAKISYLGN